MVSETDARARKSTFLLCRYALIIATGGLAYAEVAKEASPLPIVGLIALAVASNMLLGQASPFSFFDAWTQAPVLIADTAMISIALLLTRATQESCFFFFFLLIMAAKIESLVILAIGAALIGFASFLLSDPGAGWAAPTLMRVPFMFAAGIFFGYVVLPERTGQMTGFNSASQVITRRPLEGGQTQMVEI
jgi:hypothetical protein